MPRVRAPGRAAVGEPGEAGEAGPGVIVAVVEEGCSDSRGRERGCVMRDAVDRFKFSFARIVPGEGGCQKGWE